MTSTRTEIADDVGPDAAPAVRHAPWTDRRVLPVVLVALAAMYALLLNSYWSPGGDSELFVVIARSLLRGHGYTYNGQPVTITPPAWPVVLAGLMAVSPTFLFLKVCLGAMMLGALGLTYAVLRGYATPGRAGLVLFLVGSSVGVYSLTMWLHTEAFFLLVAGGAMLLAHRLSGSDAPRRGRAWWASAVGLVGLSVVMVLTRWQGLFQWVVLAGLLLRADPPTAGWRRAWRADAGTRLPRLVLAGVLAAAMAGTFFAAREGMRAYADRKMAVESETGEVTLENGMVLDPEDVGGEVESLPIVPSAGRKQSMPEQFARRILGGGDWFSWAIWEPARFGRAVAPVGWFALAVGWLVAALVGVAAVDGWRRGRPVWAAVLLYCATLVVLWPQPVSRYFVPVLPFLILGVLRGLDVLRDASPTAARRRVATLAAGAFVGAIAATNAGLYAVDAYVARSGPAYYATYWGGLHGSLVSACRLLEGRGVRDWKVAVAERYENLGGASYEPFGTRAAAMLSDAVVRRMPKSKRGKNYNTEPNGAILTWCRARKVEYYLYQRPVTPWVVWHFRLPPWAMDRLSKRPRPATPAGPSGGWVLYEMVRRDGRSVLVPVDVPESVGWPTRVPGL